MRLITIHNTTSKTEQSELLTSQRAQTPPQNSMGSSSRRLRAFKRWMRSQGIDFSDALQFTDDGEAISVRALCDLRVGDMVARIPKTTCLTVKTSGASDLIESAGLGGSLGLSVAVMYERSLGQSSPWAPYLHLLPPHESLPLLWSLREVDSLLCGTELHKVGHHHPPLFLLLITCSILFECNPITTNTPNCLRDLIDCEWLNQNFDHIE